ncbi:eukaryotic translation initiation factor 2 beta subunit [Actinidia rufa]|uniref:Eukaryotic translation initiation factor 2 subunit beta n=1 Tax=Actinidia rufa TaxID=165716 RepID=A0A7J0EBW0_9ERIC|nr:eukaryotic translation initiation factor 2 beta subunit [Actinidia rufa]
MIFFQAGRCLSSSSFLFIAPFDPTKKKKKKKPVIQDAEVDTTDTLAENTENLSISEGVENAFIGLKKKKKKPVETDSLNDENVDKEEDLDGEDEEGEEIALQQQYPWEGSNRDYDYEELLGRVFNILRENNPELAGDRRRTVMRPPQVLREGTKKTVFVNFMDLCKTMHRQPEHVMTFLLAEMGTSGSLDGQQRLVVKGRFAPKNFEGILRRYINEYVICNGCKSPDTILSKENRLFFLRCEQCGSGRSVAPIKAGFVARACPEGQAHTSLNSTVWFDENQIENGRGPLFNNSHVLHHIVTNSRKLRSPYTHKYNVQKKLKWWLLTRSMDTHAQNFGFRNAFWLAVIVFLNKNLSYIMVDSSDDHFAYLTINHGSYEFGEVEDNAWTMVQKQGNQFVVNDRPFYVNGFNTYWLMMFAVDQSTRGKVGEAFRQASSVGLTVCRTWAFNDGQWRALQKSPSVYDEDVFKALDFVVSEAKKYRIRLILSLTNNWDAYGGKAQYVKWGKAAGLNLTSDDDFFTHPTIRSYYKAHVKACSFLLLISPEISDAHIPFVATWMQAHIEDADNVLGMPVVFGEFGVSAEDPGYNSSFRDTLISTVYTTLLNSAKKGGSGGGSLLWQVFPEGTGYMDDGYAIVLSKSPSTSNIVSLQSKRLTTFNSLCSWKCRWGCKKKRPSESYLYRDDL